MKTKTLRQVFATMLLVLALSVAAYAGDMSGPTSPAPGDVDGPSSAPAPGDVEGPSTRAVASMRGLTLAMVMQLIRDSPAWY